MNNTAQLFDANLRDEIADDVSTLIGAKLATALVQQQFRWSMKNYLAVEMFVCGQKIPQLNVTDL